MSMEMDSGASGQWKRNMETLQRNAGQLFLEALRDPLTIEVMLNPDGRLWVERLGEEKKIIGSMEGGKAEALMRVVASSLKKTITYERPILNGEFPLDGSRFAGTLSPVVSGPTFAIRRKASRVFSMDDYVASGTMTQIQKDVLCEAVADHKNILVIGGTSSGKTTLTNALIGEMVRLDPNERIFIFEDTGEIQCLGVGAVFFHTTEEVGMTQLLELALRMRPDRICVGEIRNHAALDLMDAWNTGHDGGIATIHATSAERGLTRLQGLITRSPHKPSDIEDVIGESVQRIVFIAKTPEGRRVQKILAINGFSKQKQEYEITELAA